MTAPDEKEHEMPAPAKKSAPVAVAKPAEKPSPDVPENAAERAWAAADAAKSADPAPTLTPDDPAPVGTPEELDAAAKYHITVEQLREIRAQAAGEVVPTVIGATDDGLDPKAKICGVHWPDGWPAGGDHAECEHGVWTRGKAKD